MKVVASNMMHEDQCHAYMYVRQLKACLNTLSTGFVNQEGAYDQIQSKWSRYGRQCQDTRGGELRCSSRLYYEYDDKNHVL